MGNDGPVQLRACISLSLFPASCPVSPVLCCSDSHITRNDINNIYFIVCANAQKRFERGNSQSRLRDSISMGCGPFARISRTSLSFPGLPVTNTAGGDERVFEGMEGEGK